MRLEVHLILWVTAAALVAASLFIGWDGERTVTSFQGASIGLEQDRTNPSDDQQAAVEGDVPGGLPNIDPSLRGLFPSAQPMAVYDELVSHPGAKPVVVGIFSSAGRMAALIVQGGEAQPRLVEAGDALGGFLVRQITMDGVVLENTADGTQDSILLRGAGELP